MGSSFSYLKEEQETWANHKLMFDEKVRENNLKFLDEFKDGSKLFMGNRTIQFGNISFERYFVTDKTRFLEFTSPDMNLYSARVAIHYIASTNFEKDLDPYNVKPMDSKVRDRMRHVLGLSNYSLCLRNSEHVANYVIKGRWFSSQMFENGGSLMQIFRNELDSNALKRVNAFPSSVKPDIFSRSWNKKLYSFLEDRYSPVSMEYYLDSDAVDTYNILVVGPTGAGKSHLINVFFNQPVCDAEMSHRSVTQEVCFIRGTGNLMDPATKEVRRQSIVVADTVGLCDTEYDDDRIVDLIKGRISANIKTIDAVFIVFQAGRLYKEHVKSIRAILDWLQYKKDDRHLNFLFVGTHADHLTDSKKEQLRKEAVKMLDLKPTNRKKVKGEEDKYESLVYTGFPPEEFIGDNQKMQEAVDKSLEALQPLLLHVGVAKKIARSKRAEAKGGDCNSGHWNRFKTTIPVTPRSCSIL